MSSKQTLEIAGLKHFLNELLELTAGGVKDASVRDLPQSLKVEDMNMKLSCKTSLEN